MVFLERLAELTEEKGLTKHGIEAGAGLGMGLIARWEAGTGTPTFKTVKKIADFLEVTPSYLLGDSNFRSKEEEQHAYELLKGSVDTVPWYKIPAYESPGDLAENGKNPSSGYEAVPMTLEGKEQCVAIKVTDDILCPYALKGDILIVHKQDNVQTDGIILALAEGGKPIIGKSIWHEGGFYVIPPNFQNDIYSFTVWDMYNIPIDIIGRVVEIRRKL